MEATLKIWETNRNNYLKHFNYSLEQLNHIPQGFSNNLIWNLGHIVAIQQRLLYRGSGLPMNISDEFFETYKPGSKPTGKTTQAEADEIKTLLTSMIDVTKRDLAAGKFTNYTAFTSLTGFHIGNLNDAIQFNNYHEAMHLGFMANIRKFV
ncbi:MAG: hypothetical protein K0S32_107 [Bacteroidetes bacterium]|jgi:hypothetical protein|nr:hypothetical protein [Bacteroidota bacterium]